MFGYGQTLTVVRPGTPGFGGDPGTPEADRDIDGWAFFPGESSETVNHSDQVVADYSAVKVGDADVDIEATDQIRNPTDTSQLLALIGDPLRYTNPFTGQPVVEIRLRKVTG